MPTPPETANTGVSESRRDPFLSRVKKWFKREPVTIIEEKIVVDPQSTLKAQYGDTPTDLEQSYLKLDQLLRSTKHSDEYDHFGSAIDESFLIWAWLNGCDDLEAFLEEVKNNPSEIKHEEPGKQRTWDDKQHIVSMKRFLGDSPSGFPTKSKVLGSEARRDYAFPPSDDPAAKFPFDRTAALSRGGVYTPSRLTERDRSIVKQFDDLKLLGLKPQLPADLKKKVADYETGPRRFFFDENRQVKFSIKSKKKAS